MAIGVLLINLGTPDSASEKDVKRYLTQFLNDKYVIDINPISRFFLVNFIIIPFRAANSTKLYQAIWTKAGSPLLIHSLKQKELLQKALGNGYVVELGMRYQKPSIESALENLKDKNVSEIVCIPLYPQYATSSTKSSIEEVCRILKEVNFAPVKFIESFYNDEDYINAMADVASKYELDKYDHFLFSYHGLPERQITKESSFCKLNDECCSMIVNENRLCYRAGCYETTRRLAEKLNIPKEKYTLAFQSRLDDKWLKPYSDKIVAEKAKSGIKRMLVFSPAFVADCLETIYEIGIEYQEIFRHHGGETLDLVESLNKNPKWIEALKKLVLENT